MTACFIPHRGAHLGALALAFPLAFAGPALRAGVAPPQPGPPPPNVVFILVDDLGWADTSSSLASGGHASAFVETPAIERLAEEGMVFTSAYVSSPTCAPARTGLLTGQYAPRPTNNVFQVRSLNRGGPNTLLVGPEQGTPSADGSGDLLDQIPAAAVTIAETLRTVGYRNAQIGKYDVGSASIDNAPLDQGFDYDASLPSLGTPRSGYHAMFNAGAWHFRLGAELDEFAAPYTQEYVDQNVRPYSSGVRDASLDALVGTPKHATDALADATIEWIEANKASPVYVQFHHWAVHSPIDSAQARADLLAKYEARPPADEDGDGPDAPAYAALIEGVDQSIARLLDYLETSADPRRPGHVLADNTLVLFMSDNGGKQRQTNSGPLRGQKGELREGGIRVPLVAWGPSALVDGGTLNPTPVIGIDFHATLAELAGAETGALVLDGVSLAPILADVDAELGREALYWHLPGYLRQVGREQVPQTAVRKGAMKLVYGYEDARWELYDLAADPGETLDLAAALPEVVDELACDMTRWLVEIDAPLPTFREDTLYADGSTYSAGSTVPLPAHALGAVERYCSATPTSAGPGARIGLDGFPSVSATRLTLVGSGVVPHAWGLFFYGPSAVEVPFGEGLRCVGGSVTRLTPALRADAAGELSLDLDLASPPMGIGGPGQVVAGSTHHFQLLFRDALGGPQGFNLSDGLRVTFCP